MITPRIGAILAILSASVGAQNERKPEPWDYCSGVEGKGVYCFPGEAPKTLEYFMHPGRWPKREWFSAVLRADQMAKVRPKLQEIGRLGPSRILMVNYSDEFPFASILLAEHSPGQLAPIMRFEGGIEPKIHHPDGGEVIEITQDYSGLYPTVVTWAWVWSPKGPLRLDVEQSIVGAIGKAEGVQGGYSAVSLDWDSLKCVTYGWTGEFRNKLSANTRIDIWFKLNGDTLEPKRVEWQGDDGSKHWP